MYFPYKEQIDIISLTIEKILLGCRYEFKLDNNFYIYITKQISYWDKELEEFITNQFNISKIYSLKQFENIHNYPMIIEIDMKELDFKLKEYEVKFLKQIKEY